MFSVLHAYLHKLSVKNWRYGKRTYGSIRKAHHIKPGDGTMCDQMMSAQPGLLPRMGGRHTKDRITAVSVFLDSVTGHSLSHLQISTGGDETLAAKRAHELMADSHGVVIKSFHADNGIYAEKVFTDEVTACGQTITFCGVGAHLQNGVAENHIGCLTRGTRTSILHAQRRWPEAVGKILLPFAWKSLKGDTMISILIRLVSLLCRNTLRCTNLSGFGITISLVVQCMCLRASFSL